MMNVKSVIKKIDYSLNRAAVQKGREKPALLILAFHSIAEDGPAACAGAFDPRVNHGITVEGLRYCIEHFLGAGYSFISPLDLLRGLLPGQRYVMLTFDDGYANNRLALPVMRRFRVPAVFFVSSENVRLGQGFWWDIVYRRRHKQGWPGERIFREQQKLKTMGVSRRQSYLRDTFGEQALYAQSDEARPFTPCELREFSRESLVFVGNHTMHHGMSVYCSREELEAEVKGAQQYLASLIGKEPVIFAYPGGHFNESSVEAVKNAGIPLAVTLGWRKNYLPLDDREGRLRLARFVINGHEDIPMQCILFRADGSLYGIIKRLVNRYSSISYSSLSR